MHKRSIAALIAAILGFALAIPLISLPAAASSHREAPTIANDPNADNTDVYAFVSPDKTDSVTLVANYWPFEAPAGGPNFYPFADDVQYNIHVDNVGDAQDHIVFTYTFHTTTLNANTFLYNVGPMTLANGGYAKWNRPQTYELDMTRNGVKTVLGQNLLVPPDNVGPHSVGSPTAYDTLAKGAISNLAGGYKSFAGQRSDPFFVDLGGAFDLLSINPAGGKNYLAGYDVNSLVLQIPKTVLDGPNCDHTIGVWATSGRHGTTTINSNGSRTSVDPTFVQTSRLGNPLVNEVVMDFALKDAFNALPPAQDHTIPAVVKRVTDPELAALFVALGIDANAPLHNRTDLVTVFLTGVPGLNKPNNPNQVAAEMLRLNYSIAPSSTNPNAVNRMGVLGGQTDGFPNGRRLADDVTDIELQAVDGVLCQPGGPLAGSTPCRPNAVNPALGDGVSAADTAFQICFPYLANPKGPATSGAPVSTCPAATFPATSAAAAVPAKPPLLILGLLAVVALMAAAGLGFQRRKANA